ncbi:hypothetical protein ZIOFF_007100 [Zingiber officinale]|uniref:Aminoacyl-transfer RNA synthetases class-II family profile domain-containing protein n=1 Tax=Zingiber officinale TaxID=94328 RepID=A0A8J5LSS1_ZINOF|nr:hypothetical protein ZIOFF_007100 [Zingiber officinale]
MPRTGSYLHLLFLLSFSVRFALVASPSSPKSVGPFKTLGRSNHLSDASSSPMAFPEESLRRVLAEKQAAVDAQAEAVRVLKGRPGADKPEIDAAVETLKALKVEAGATAAARCLQAAVSSSGNGSAEGSREAFLQAAVNTLERRLFYIPSFKIYGGVPGLYDYDPPGCAVKSNVFAFWRLHFVLEENMLDVDCPCVMPETSIGPSGLLPGYMRSETAQGIFVNFKDLHYYNGSKLPFAAAEIGQAFRNEISPRQGILRVREFTLAEIEHYVDPEDTCHPKFIDVANLEFLMFPRNEQMTGESAKPVILGEAVSKGIVNNETLDYFIGMVYLFLTPWNRFHTQPSKSEDEQLNVFRFPPLVAPIKCTVFPLIKTQEFDDVAQIIAKSLTAAGISHIDTTVWSSLRVSELPFTCTSIGKRYAWTDEIGVPFAVTVDSTDSVMIQERGQQGADLCEHR